MNFLFYLLGALSALSGILLLWQWFAARRFPLHQRVAQNDFQPAITIFKPLKGADETTRASLASWLQQTYAGPVQLLFAVADENDPVTEIVRQLIAQNPNADARLVVCKLLRGVNAKAAKLAQLQPLAKHDLILICDADVRVPPDFLANFVIPLRDEKVGLVNCFYRLANPANAAMRWEAVAVNTDFWSQVLQSAMLKPLDFALGAAILVRSRCLAEIGGFAALADCLADDYQLGNRVARQGHRIALCPVVVECWDAPANWRGVWKHQLRWARTIRVCQPVPYFFSLLANATLWPLLWLLLQLCTTTTLCPALLVAALLLMRVAIAQDLQRRFHAGSHGVFPGWLVWLKDILGAATWAGAFAGNTVEWRGRRLILQRDGTLSEPR